MRKRQTAAHSLTHTLLACLLALCGAVVFSPLAQGEAPPLPPGLDSSAAGASEADSGAPPLPEGLGEASPSGAPSLPPGLESEAPPLPPGLGEGEDKVAKEEQPGVGLRDRFPLELHGFWEVRAGVRTQDDAAQPADATLGETRLQLETEKAWQNAVLEFTGDAYLDAVLEDAGFDLRQLRLTWTPFDALDIRLGRQVLTWGTGDMLFINDLFPKDWQSFFIGRDQEYLKAPGDAVKVGWFNDWVNVEVVYTPQFDRDRHITGERISYYDPLSGRSAGQHRALDTNPPSTWFEDDELAVRLYRNIGSAELAFYGYSGYWKSPGGMRFIPIQATFPKLRVYGASLRGMLGKGVGNIELGYYDSYQDRDGDNFLVNNSEFRLLLGYERELAKEFTGAFQYYLEHMMDYDAYRRTLPFIMETRDENRHVFTVRLTKLLMNQNLILSLFTYYSPSDADAYLRPKATYKVNDRWTVEAGGNVFLGASAKTFFGQFEDNTNLYASARLSF